MWNPLIGSCRAPADTGVCAASPVGGSKNSPLSPQTSSLSHRNARVHHLETVQSAWKSLGKLSDRTEADYWGVGPEGAKRRRCCPPRSGFRAVTQRRGACTQVNSGSWQWQLAPRIRSSRMAVSCWFPGRHAPTGQSEAGAWRPVWGSENHVTSRLSAVLFFGFNIPTTVLSWSCIYFRRGVTWQTQYGILARVSCLK